jgi:dimethylglycine dehydrogenase
MPSWRHTNFHGPVLRECAAVMQGVGIMDLTPFSKYEVHGEDAARFLDGMVANTLPPVCR